MPDLIDRLERRIRRHLLDTMPPDPSGELAAMRLDELLLVYGNWRSRLVSISRRPRSLLPFRAIHFESPSR
ncbi:MAG TPA: hypothetical protein VND98_06675 [Solirubrobacterales bacterium]|nr:hypothetical protein [Solirubrobacterales bacterium]